MLIKKILTAVDGSKHSSHALNWAVELATKWDADLIIVSVVPPISPLVYMGPAPMYIKQYNKVATESHQKVLDRSSAKIKEMNPGITIETRLERGRPADVIVEIAQNEDVDLIVMGSRGIGDITGWILGSTSRSVVNECTKPIIIVK